MPLTAGSTLGGYEIVGLVGAGGMGEVYRARDLRLKREVAIKVLPEAFSREPDRVARFQREAEVLASLNHPHIAAIYGFELVGSTRFLVLEFIEGETLADRIRRGPMSIAESIAAAEQIAEALEAAHDRGIVHRDLKPSNVALTRGGQVKILDFGLAKVREARDAEGGISHSPTITAVSAGVILGTAAYMSPEQATGRDADHTTDIWGFGCVLYEMLTGRPVFEGDTVTELLANVLKAEPDWSRVPADVPAAVRRVLRRCLAKDRRRRLRHIADARLDLDDVEQVELADAMVSRGQSRRERAILGTALAVVTLAAIVQAVWMRRPGPSATEMRLDIATPPTSDPVSLAISPDGKTVAFVARFEGGSRLWVRSLDSATARALPGTESATFPFWSPDGRSLGFFADRQLKRIDIGSGSIQVLANIEGGRGGAWNDDGTIVFEPSPGIVPMFRIAASGGEPAALAQQGRFPQFLPDRRHFLYYRPGTSDTRGVYVAELGSPDSQRLLETEAAAVYASDHLLFVRQTTLFARPFDAGSLKLTGDAFPIADQITVNGPLLRAPLAVSAAGPIAYRTGSAGGQRQFVWFDRSGKELGTIGEPAANMLSPSASPDGRRIAVHRAFNNNGDIWLLDLGRGVLSRFTTDPAADSNPMWSPDGRRIVFSSIRNGHPGDLYQKAVDSADSDQVLLASAPEKWVTDWSPDGRFLLFITRDPKSGRDLWALPMDGDRKPFSVVQTAFEEEDGQFSPDARWIAYQSNESGRFEIYVRPFQGPGRTLQISDSGGAQVRWRRDAKELFYIALDGKLMAVPLRVASAGTGLEAGTPRALFAMQVGGPLQTNSRQQYVVSPDGQRFLVNTLTEDATSPITLILNWAARSETGRSPRD